MLTMFHGEDFKRKLDVALGMTGFRFLLIHSPCPTGWKSEPSQTVQLVRDAVNSGLFPLYEVYDGTRYRVNYELDGTDPAKYYEGQRRFPKGPTDLDKVRADARVTYDRLTKLAATWPAAEDE